jgi:hypothetical protein
VRPAAELTEHQRAWIASHKAEIVAELQRRPIVAWRLGDRWHVLHGQPGESFADAVAGLRRQFPDVAEVRERHVLPPGFPFGQPDNEQEGK